MSTRPTVELSFAMPAIVILLALGGCGDDANGEASADAATPDAARMDAGTDAASPDANEADTGPSTPQPVTCGATVCSPVEMTFDGTSIGVLPACCVDDACGVEMESARSYNVVVPDGCVLLAGPGTPDETCPSAEYEFPMLNASTVFAGCCLPSGTCGVNADLTDVAVGDTGTLAVADLGCVEAADFVEGASEPPSCTYE